MATSIQETRATSVKPLRRTRRGWLVASGTLLLLAVASVSFFSSAILFALGNLLVNAQPPRNADIILVIGGDFVGERILEGAELEREGYAPAVFVSGGGSVYGFHETDLELEFIRNHGYTAEKFIQFRYPAASTFDEAVHVIPQLRAMGVHSYLLVTSPSHTARAGRVFHRIAPDMQMRVIAAPDLLWVGGRWWATREGRKLWLMESMKTLADLFQI